MTESGKRCLIKQGTLPAVNCDRRTADIGHPLEYSGEVSVNCRKDRMLEPHEEEPRQRIQCNGRECRKGT